MAEHDEVTIRAADRHTDAQLIEHVDAAFETRQIFEVVADGHGFQLVTRSLDAPVRKAFPLNGVAADRRWSHAWLALDASTPVGFIATAHEVWNKRAVIWHLYVSGTHRKRGIGRRLLEISLAEARQAGMRWAWLETSNLNVPGVAAYRRLGFELCGLDVGLYDGTPAEGEVALFLRRAL
jgi:ribosomal protein S18 acetylase RimI-like enzyme